MANGSTSRAKRIPLSEKVYTWWSYRAADWTVGDRGRRLDHIWVSRALKDGVSDFRITRDARGWDAAVGPCAGYGDAGGVIAFRFVRGRNANRYPPESQFAKLDAQLGAGHQDMRWRAGWCGWRVRRAAGAPRPDRFRARAETGCARPGSRWNCSSAIARRRPLHRHHQREFADQRARACDRFRRQPSSIRNAPR